MCSVFACKTKANASSFKEGVTFHGFPTDSARRKLWIEACNRHESWEPATLGTVCSKHFDDSSFEIQANNTKRLKPDAVPKRTKQYPPKKCPFQNKKAMKKIKSRSSIRSAVYNVESSCNISYEIPCTTKNMDTVYVSASEPTSQYIQIKSEIIEDEDSGQTTDSNCQVYGTHKKLDKDCVKMIIIAEQNDEYMDQNASVRIQATVSPPPIKLLDEYDIEFSERDDNCNSESNTSVEQELTDTKYLRNLDRICEIAAWDSPDIRILKLAVKSMRYDTKKQLKKIRSLEQQIRYKNRKIESLYNLVRQYEVNPSSFRRRAGASLQKPKRTKKNQPQVIITSTEEKVTEEQELGERLEEQRLGELFEEQVSAENPLL